MDASSSSSSSSLPIAGPSGPGREEIEERVKHAKIEARAQTISHRVRCTECGNQSIEDSQADVAILLRKIIRDELKAGRSDKEIYDKLVADFGDSVLYAPPFDLQTAVLWLIPLISAGTAISYLGIRRYKQRTNFNLLADKLLDAVPVTATERQTIRDLVRPPPKKWWS